MTDTQTYPVNGFFKARNVLKPSFEITGVDHLFVNFDKFRSNASSKKLNMLLGIESDGHLNEDAGFAKIFYTGHPGSGKSTELEKLHHKLNRPAQYFSVYLDIEDYIAITDFKSEDLIVIIIASLVNCLVERQINYDVPGMQKIAEDWLSDTSVSEELIRKTDNEGGASAEIGTGGLLKLFSAKAFIKSVFSYSAHTSTTVRRKVLEKQGDYIDSLNLALINIKENIRLANQGKDILIVIDGLEKLRGSFYDNYKQVLIQNTRLIEGLNCSIITCVPIDTWYDKQTNPIISKYDHVMLPLIPIDDDTVPVFSEIISRRIDKDAFFEDGVLEYCVRQSGGNPRQLIKIVEAALLTLEDTNDKISLHGAEKACSNLGLDLVRRLSGPDFELLKVGNYNRSDDNIKDLLFNLSLMEYNGSLNTRRPNPLLEPFLK